MNITLQILHFPTFDFGRFHQRGFLQYTSFLRLICEGDHEEYRIQRVPTECTKQSQRPLVFDNGIDDVISSKAFT